MPYYRLPDGKFFAKYEQASIDRFRLDFSKELKERYCEGAHTAEEINAILSFSFDWYSNRFIELLNSQEDVAFFQVLFGLHEFASKAQQTNRNVSPIPQMSAQDFAIYRRVLRLCLEHACELKLFRNNTFPDLEFLEKKEGIICDILYLGDFLYEFADLIAMQKLIEDSIELKFNDDGLFYFTRKHHYNEVVNCLFSDIKEHLAHAVIDNQGQDDFRTAFRKCHGIGIEELVYIIVEIEKRNEPYGGKLAMEEWYAFPKNLELMFNVPYAHAENLFQGLTLRKENKLSILQAIFRPNNINKYLYRPILVWNVDGKDRAIVGQNILSESLISLYSNAFGWNKAPEEWLNSCFKDFIKSKTLENDKVLEDEIEKILKENNILYDRNLKSLKKWNNQGLNINNSTCGEIDFLFIHNDTLYICDSKHLISRYDMNNFLNDYSSFEKEKGYNDTMRRKVKFLEEKKSLVFEHFQVLAGNKEYEFEYSKVEGIFVINTPTFIMFNNDLRIYTIKSFKEFANNTFEDIEFEIFKDEVDRTTIISVQYPYFRKPKYFKFNDFD